MNSSILWDITQCSPLKVNWYLGGICRPHLQGRRISQARKQRQAGGKMEVACSSEILMKTEQAIEKNSWWWYWDIQSLTKAMINLAMKSITGADESVFQLNSLDYIPQIYNTKHWYAVLCNLSCRSFLRTPPSSPDKAHVAYTHTARFMGWW
jgi:hypothetical protein